MKVSELLGEAQIFQTPHIRKRYDKRRDVRRRATTFNLVTANGQVVASGLTPQKAQLMVHDQSLIQKYGKLYTRNILFRQ
jgi:hypothetical protein